MRLAITRQSMWIIALAVAAVTFVGGLIAVLSRPVSYSATAAVLIAPPAGDPSLSVAGSDTLSRGTIIATYAQTYASGKIVQAAFAKAGLPAAETASVSIQTRVVAGTSIIRITATSPSPSASEKAANALAVYTPSLAGYSVAFTPSVIQTADGGATRTGASTALLVVMLLAFAIAAGALAFAGLRRVNHPRSRSAEAPPSGEPELDDAPADRIPTRTDAPPSPAR